MREILFRGKRLDNSEWVEGHLLRCEDGRARITPRHTDIFCLADNDNILLHIAYEVIPETVGQFTGIIDKTGKKIFEGDIIKSKYLDNSDGTDIALVEWVDSSCGFEPFSDSMNNCGHCGGGLYSPEKSEIVGNIYDNPEILTRETK